MRSQFPICHSLYSLKKLGWTAIVLLSFLIPAQLGYSQLNAAVKNSETVQQHATDGRILLITVIDSDDDTIGKRCETDMEEILFGFEDLADWLNLKMEEPKIVKGADFGKAGVNDAIDHWLRSQEPTESDVVVFYYSGHGFRYTTDKSEYPRMWLKTSEDKNPETANLRIEQDVYDRIVKMGAGVNIILSDCCNTYVAGVNSLVNDANVAARKRVTHKREEPKEGEQKDDGDENAEKLFVPNQPLTVLATAAEKGEYAGGKTETGGFFTYYFLEALDECIYNSNLEPTWENIFRYVDKNASYWAKSAMCPDARHNKQGRCIQTVKFNVSAGGN